MTIMTGNANPIGTRTLSVLKLTKGKKQAYMILGQLEARAMGECGWCGLHVISISSTLQRRRALYVSCPYHMQSL